MLPITVFSTTSTLGRKISATLTGLDYTLPPGVTLEELAARAARMRDNGAALSLNKNDTDVSGCLSGNQQTGVYQGREDKAQKIFTSQTEP